MSTVPSSDFFYSKGKSQSERTKGLSRLPSHKQTQVLRNGRLQTLEGHKILPSSLKEVLLFRHSLYLVDIMEQKCPKETALTIHEVVRSVRYMDWDGVVFLQ